MSTNLDNFHLFRFNSNVVAVCASNWENEHEQDYVLRTDLERQFGTVFPPSSTRFISNGLNVRYTRGSDLQIIVPERIRCIGGRLIEISEVQSEMFSDDTASSYSHQVTTEVVAMEMSVGNDSDDGGGSGGGVGIDGGSDGSEGNSGGRRDVNGGNTPGSHETRSEACSLDEVTHLSFPALSSRSSPGAPQLYSPVLQEEKLALQFFRQQSGEFRKWSLIYQKAEEILLKRVSFYESNSPRLFIVLPVDGSVVGREDNGKVSDANQWNQFRVHFLCEAGQDGKEYFAHATKESHEGYCIRRPKEFFEKFGPYLFVMMQVLRLGVITGKYRFESLGEDVNFFQNMYRKDKSESRLHTVDWEKDLADLKEYLLDVEKTDLTKVADFLRTAEVDRLAGLYRVMDSNSNAYWVCKHHHSKISGTSEATWAGLTHLASCNRQLGQVTASLKSATAASTLYSAMSGKSGIHELVMKMDWVVSLEDLIMLKVAIKQIWLSKVTIDLNGRVGPESESTWEGRYKPLFDALMHSTLQSVCLEGVVGLWSRSVIPIGEGVFLNLRHVRIPWSDADDILDSEHRAQLEKFLGQARNVENLLIDIFIDGWKKIMAVLNAVVRSRKVGHCNMMFTLQNATCCWLKLELPMPSNFQQLITNDLNEMDFFREHGPNVHALGIHLPPDVLLVLAKSLRNGSKLISVKISGYDGDPMEQILSQSPIEKVQVRTNPIKVTPSLFKSIPWGYLSTLRIDIFRGVAVGKVLEALTGWVRSISSEPRLKRVELVITFKIDPVDFSTLLKLIKLLSVEELVIGLDADDEAWAQLIKTIDYSTLEWLHLALRGRDSRGRKSRVPLNHIPKDAWLLKLSTAGFEHPTEQVLQARGIPWSEESTHKITDRWFQ